MKKKVAVYPLSQEEIYHPVIVQCMNSDECREFRLQFTRPPPSVDSNAAKGYVIASLSFQLILVLEVMQELAYPFT